MSELEDQIEALAEAMALVSEETANGFEALSKRIAILESAFELKRIDICKGVLPSL